MAKQSPVSQVPALKVCQWLPEWDSVAFDPKQHRQEPLHWFYQFSIPATYLKALSGIYPRTTNRAASSQDLGIQRRHEPERSNEIAEFVRYGYPWSELSKAKRKMPEFDNLRKPGWLPTAIVVNIHKMGDRRQGKQVSKKDLVDIQDDKGGISIVKLPSGFSGPSWRPDELPPIEVIDGQHRLWAFEQQRVPDDFEVPVVAFHGLDISWQAYLFYTINIKPKKINASLAFDLYPLLRTEDWLERFEGHIIYRETRAQELVDLLWSYPESPWYKRINMLGEPGSKGLMVSQAAWIRSLLATYVKSWESNRTHIGGLFGAKVGRDADVLSWGKFEQAAFLIVAGDCLKAAIQRSKDPWVKVLRQQPPPELFDKGQDIAYVGPNTLINQDQGIRAFLHVTNDLCYVRADTLKLSSWGRNEWNPEKPQEALKLATASLRKTEIGHFLKDVADTLASYDWRASEAPSLTESERLLKAAFRGSGGYKEMRKQLLDHLWKKGSQPVSRAASEVLTGLGYK